MRLRLAVFRSNKSIYGQLIDDNQQKTILSISEKKLSPAKGEPKLTKIEKAKLMGKLLAKEALKKKIEEVFFDRRHYRYHGRVKAFAEGAREGGLRF